MRIMNWIFAACIVLTGCISGSATAGDGDGPKIVYGGPDAYSYKLTLLPDIDQRRDGLPGDGSMYCVPTAILNACAYAGNHGFGGEVICEDVWMLYYALDLFFEEVTFLDHLFGALMNTDAEDGTYMNGGFTGAKAAMSGGFLTLAYSKGNGNVPNFDGMANIALNGGLVVAIVGWYDDEFETTRDGGHAMTVAKIARNGDQRVIGVHDPASDEAPNNLTSQSGFTREDYGIARELRLVDGVPVLMDRLIGLGGNGKIALIDGFYAFIPHHAYTWGGKDGLIDPVEYNWNLLPQIQLQSPHPIIALMDDSSNASIFVLQAEEDIQTKLSMVNIVHQNEVTVLEENGLKGFVISRERRLYTYDNGNRLKCRRIRGEDLPLEAEVVSDQDVNAIFFDDLNDQLLTLDGDNGFLFARSKDLVGESDGFDLGFDFGNNVQMTMEPRSGRVWVASYDMEFIVGYDRNTNETTIIEHPVIENILTIDMTPDGNIRLGDGDQAFFFTTEGELVNNSRWAGLGGGPVLFPTSKSNFDPDLMIGPSFTNELPDTFNEGIPWCSADFNGDDQVDVTDLLQLLAAWGTDDEITDIDGNTIVDINDLLTMLGMWGQCA